MVGAVLGGRPRWCSCVEKKQRRCHGVAAAAAAEGARLVCSFPFPTTTGPFPSLVVCFPALHLHLPTATNPG